MRARLPRRWRPESRTKTALWIVLGIGVITSVTVGSVWASYSSQTDNTGATVATGLFTLNDTANYATTTLNVVGGINNSTTSITVTSDSGFPQASNYTIQIDNEQMTVTGGQGSTTWTVIRGVDGTTAASHSNGATVSTAACSSAGSGSSNNVNTACDAVIGYSSATENYPGTSTTRTIQIADAGSIGASDLEAWMPGCLRGVTADAPWASNTTTVSSFSSASNAGGNLAGGTTYYYEITAVVGGTEQVAGTEASYTPPTGTSTNEITLNWTAVGGASAYKIYRSTVEGDEQLVASPGNVTSWQDTAATTTQLSYPPLGHGSGNPCFTPRQTFLNGAINNSTTSITLDSNTGFPPTGTFTILVDSEQMTVTAQGTSGGFPVWTVTRGANGTTAASHSDQEPVELLDRATTLAGTITNSQTSITVSSAAGFPTDPDSPFRILVYNPDGSNIEEMTVTGGQGTTTWTVTRGVGGTSATTKAAGAVVLPLDDTSFYLEETNSDASAKECFYPAVRTSLSGAINNSTTSIAVASASGFPSSGNYGIIVDGEEMTVTGGQGTTTWTVTRGAHSTTATAHSNLAAVYASSCSFDPTSDLGYFAANFNALLQAVDFGSGPASLATRYFTLGLEYPSYASDAMQGTEALFTVRWHAQS